MDIHSEEHDWGLRTYISIEGERQPGALDYRPPNRMNLHLVLMGRKMMLSVACVPVEAQRTSMLMSTSREFLEHPIFDWIFNRANLRIAEEDREVVESCTPTSVPPANEEQSVRTDAPVLRFRKDYFARLKGSSASARKAADAESTSREPDSSAVIDPS